MAVVVQEISADGLPVWAPFEDFDTTPSIWGFWEKHFKIFAGEVCNPQLGAITAGTGYTDGVYENVELKRNGSTSVAGQDLLCRVTVAGGGVSSVEVTQKGSGFETGDVLWIANVSQAGGTGSGFLVNVDSADSSVGLMRGPSAVDSYEMGLMVGIDRHADYTKGVYWHRSGSTTTTYSHQFYGWSESTTNNGYGSMYVCHSTGVSNSMINTGNYQIRVIYCTEPNNQFFHFTDSLYKQGPYLVRMVRDPANGPWPSPQICSEWCLGYNNYIRNFTNAYESDLTTGAYSYIPQAPRVDGVLWGGLMIHSNSYIAGVCPERMRISMNVTRSFNSTMNDGVSNDIYQSIYRNIWFRVNN